MTTYSLQSTIIASIAAASTATVAGLGYVGLLLPVAFGRKIKTISYDRCLSKIATFLRSEFPTREALQSSVEMNFANDPAKLKVADFNIVALPTPVSGAHPRNFRPLVSVSETVSANTTQGAMVDESTMCPDATSEARNRFPSCGIAIAGIP